MKDAWNQRYAEPGYKYGEQPNAWLVAQAGRLAPASRCLVPGDGEGRNGVWLAGLGHTVLALDYAETGVAKARALAERRGAAVAQRYQARQADLTQWPAPGAEPVEPFDALVLVYTHLASAERVAVHRRLAQALRPGGWLILEAFHPAQLAHRSGGPRDPDMLCTLADLRSDWAGLVDEVVAWEGETSLDEGPGHQGLGHVTRWVGQRLRTCD